MRKFIILGLVLISMVLAGCPVNDSVETRDAKRVQQQQAQYEAAQPVPFYDYSLERHLLIQLYNLRNSKVSTHSVWRSDYGMVEGDCPSMGFGMPYDTSLTNPYASTDEDQEGYEKGGALVAIGQAEPNGIFASTNTSATWVMCVGPAGGLEPHYVESKVTVYPGPVEVNYTTNRVTRVGDSSVTIDAGQ